MVMRLMGTQWCIVVFVLVLLLMVGVVLKMLSKVAVALTDRILYMYVFKGDEQNLWRVVLFDL